MTFPEEFIKRITSQETIDPASLLDALSAPPPVSIRLNPYKWKLKPAGAQQVSWCSDGWYLEKRPSFTLDPLFQAGCYYPQEASSMFTGEVFRQLADERKDLRVLDLCGAPGGKSTHISSLLGDRGVLISNEVIRQRAGVLASNITKWGIPNTIVTCDDPVSFSFLGSYFDIIIVDAPCSGEGMFRDEIARNEWSTANTQLCSERQRRIVMDIWPALKPGGYLVYSTCTFNPAENEENIKWMSEQAGARSLRLDISGFTGIREIACNNVTGYGFHPGRINGDGFFISVLRKDDGPESAPRKINGRRDQRAVRNDSFSKLLNSEVPFIMSEGENHFAIPVRQDEFSLLKSGLNIVKRGTLLGQVKGNDLVPDHELAVSLLVNYNAIPSVELDYTSALAFLRRDNITLNEVPAGWVIAKYRGTGIGLFKNIGKRINNYFPVGLRVRMEAGKGEETIIRWED